MRMIGLEKRHVNGAAHAARVAERAEQLLRNVQPRPGQRYLDVGCGVGAAVRRAAERFGLLAVGVDLDPAQIDAARQASQGMPGVQFVTVDAANLPFDDASFDFAGANKALHHIPAWEKAFCEMARVLRPEGCLLLGDFLAPAWLARLGPPLLPTYGFPSGNRLLALARELGLDAVSSRLRRYAIESVWRKAAEPTGSPEPPARAT